MASLDDILVIVSNARVPNPDRAIFRVLTRARARVMFPAWRNASGEIPLGITCCTQFTVHTAAGLGFSADFAHELLRVHSELLEYERNFAWETEGYADFVRRFHICATEASQHMASRR
jgi:hypothetical protein